MLGSARKVVRQVRKMSDILERLDALEARIAHQDRTIGELNDVVTGQWRKIEMLERKVGQLLEEIHSLDASRPVQDNKPPPHY